MSMLFSRLIIVVFILVILAVLVGIVIGHASGMPGLDTSTKPIRCPIELAIVNIRQGDQWDTHYIAETKDLLAFNKVFQSLHGPNIWIGYPDGWDIPGYNQREGIWEAEITMYGCGRDWILWSWRADMLPDVRYIFIYNSMRKNCDKQGNHCGNHDFAYDGNQPMTFKVEINPIMDLYSIILVGGNNQW